MGILFIMKADKLKESWRDDFLHKHTRCPKCNHFTLLYDKKYNSWFCNDCRIECKDVNKDGTIKFIPIEELNENELRKRAEYHRKRQKGLSPFCSMGEGVDSIMEKALVTSIINFDFVKETMYKVEKYLHDNPDTRYLIDDLDIPDNKTFAILIENGDWKHEHHYLEDVVYEYLFSLGIKATHYTKEVGHSDSDCYSAWHYFVLNGVYVESNLTEDMSDKLTGTNPKEEKPKKDDTYLLKKYLTPESLRNVHDVEDVSTPGNWHSDGAIVTFMYGENKYLLDVQSGWTSDRQKFWLKEFKNLTDNIYYQKVDKSGRDVGYVYGSLDIGKLISSSAWGSTNPRNSRNNSSDHLTDSLNKRKLKEGSEASTNADTWILSKHNKWYDPEGLDIDPGAEVLYRGTESECRAEFDKLVKQFKKKYNEVNSPQLMKVYCYFMTLSTPNANTLIVTYPQAQSKEIYTVQQDKGGTYKTHSHETQPKKHHRDSACWFADYKDISGRTHKVYFYFTGTFEEAQSYLEKNIAEPYTYCKLYGRSTTFSVEMAGYKLMESFNKDKNGVNSNDLNESITTRYNYDNEDLAIFFSEIPVEMERLLDKYHYNLRTIHLQDLRGTFRSFYDTLVSRLRWLAKFVFDNNYTENDLTNLYIDNGKNNGNFFALAHFLIKMITDDKWTPVETDDPEKYVLDNCKNDALYLISAYKGSTKVSASKYVHSGLFGSSSHTVGIGSAQSVHHYSGTLVEDDLGNVGVIQSYYIYDSLNTTKKKRKKKQPYDSINKNAGNVEHNIAMFNHMSSPTDSPSTNPCGPMGEGLEADAPAKDVISEIGEKELREYITQLICEREDDLALELGEDVGLWDEFFEVNLETYLNKYREDIINYFQLDIIKD